MSDGELERPIAAPQIVDAPCFRPGGAVLKPVVPCLPGFKFTKASEPVKDESEAVVLPYDRSARTAGTVRGAIETGSFVGKPRLPQSGSQHRLSERR